MVTTTQGQVTFRNRPTFTSNFTGCLRSTPADTMTVYIRTPAGTAAALNPLTRMPRNLRQLLVSIDGSTPTSSFALRMAKEDNINVLLEVLQRAGLIRQAGPAGARHGDATGALQSATPVSTALDLGAPQSANGLLGRATSPLPLQPLQSPAASPSPQNYTSPGTQVPTTHADVRNTRTNAEPEPVTAAADIPPSEADGFSGFGTETAPAGLRPTEAVYYELANVISLMSDFVTKHLPDQSVEIVLTLESLASARQVKSSLHDYHALISPMGEVAQQHLAELQRMLEAA